MFAENHFSKLLQNVLLYPSLISLLLCQGPTANLSLSDML